MPSTNQGWRRLLILAALLVSIAVTPAFAREGFYLGGGFASQSVSGGLDGESEFGDGSTLLAVGKLEPGTGLGLLIGYGFTPLVSIEYLFVMTSHNATHQFVDIDSKATLSTGLIGVRLNWMATDALEINARLGLASGIATYKDYALHLSGPGTYDTTSEVEFTGGGYGYAVGAEWSFDKVGVGVNYSMLNIAFSSAKSSALSGDLPRKLNANISTLTALVTYYFK